MQRNQLWITFSVRIIAHRNIVLSRMDLRLASEDAFDETTTETRDRVLTFPLESGILSGKGGES